MRKLAVLFYMSWIGLLVGCSDTPVGSRMDAGMDAAVVDAGADTSVPLADVGEPCSAPDDCVEGALCIGASEGFLCMALCTQEYAVCDPGVCLPLTPRPASICFIGGDVPRGDACSTNLDCSPGSLCVGSDDTFVCAQACDATHACPDGRHCKTLDTGASICVTDVGEPCAQGQVCADPTLTCTADLGTAYLDVLGVDVCTTTPCTACDGDAVCLSYPGLPDSACFARCTSDADCRFGLGFKCLGNDLCDAFDDPMACRVALGSGSACVIPPN
ncbi:MAG: hypothetical protein R3E66_21605 [bacterium]